MQPAIKESSLANLISFLKQESSHLFLFLLFIKRPVELIRDLHIHKFDKKLSTESEKTYKWIKFSERDKQH